MKLAALFLLAVPLSAQIATVHVSASPLAKETVKSMFGKGLPKIYSAVQIDICSLQNRSLSFSLGLVRQSFSHQFPKAGVSVLSDSVASQVILSAQGASKKAVAGRIIFAAAGAGAVASGLSGIGLAWKTGLTSFAFDGPQVWSLFSTVTVPTALVSYEAQAIPETILLQPGGCLPKPAVQLVEGAVSEVQFDVSVPVFQGEPR